MDCVAYYLESMPAVCAGLPAVCSCAELYRCVRSKRRNEKAMHMAEVPATYYTSLGGTVGSTVRKYFEL